MTKEVKIEPLFARVLLRRERMKHSSILLPDGVDKRHAPAKGEVVATGPAADSSIIVGDVVLFGRHAGTWLNADGTVATEEKDAEFYVIQDEDVIARVSA